MARSYDYTARVRLPESLSRLLKSEMEVAISEANLGVFGTKIAQRYLIDRIPQVDIAAEFGCIRSTICVRIKQILIKVENAAQKLNLIDF